MREVVQKDERVAFLPWRNDFLATYLAPRLGVITYNTGGEQNLAEASNHWPKDMREFAPDTIAPHFSESVLRVLQEREADRVTLPYVDFRWAAHQWPYLAEFKENITEVIYNIKVYNTLEIRKHD